MKILLIGGGNATHVAANRLLTHGHLVTVIHSGDNHIENVTLEIENKLLPSKGTPLSIQKSNYASLASDYDLILFTTPSTYSIDFFNKNFALLNDSRASIGFLYGQGLAPIYLNHLLSSSHHNSSKLIFSLSALPWICRTVSFGSRVKIFGIHKNIFYGINSTKHRVAFDKEIKPVIDQLTFDANLIPNGDLIMSALNCTNQLLHPIRFLQLAQDFPLGFKTVDEIPLLYRNVPECVFDDMRKLDLEIFEVKKQLIESTLKYKNLRPMDLLELENTQIPMDCGSIEDLISFDKSLDNIKAPTLIKNGRFFIDQTHRIVTDDILDGLCFISILGRLLSQTTPFCDEIISINSQRQALWDIHAINDILSIMRFNLDLE